MLREEHRLKLFENRMLRRILLPKKDAGDIFIMRSNVTCLIGQMVLE
jgi:hypothetical protein